MDVISEIVKPVIKVLMDPVLRRLGYLIDCTKNVSEMQKKMTNLDIERQKEEEHVQKNTRSRLEISSQVNDWLKEVEKTKAEVENLPTEVGSCCNLKARYKLGRQAFKMTEEIDRVMEQKSLITWTDRSIALGRIDSMIASASTPSSDHDDFPSRIETFTKALKALGPNQKSHMVALCGMGGVGKTMMMQRLLKDVRKNNMFRYYVEAVVGEKTDPIAVQQAVAEYLNIELTEQTQTARATKLRQWFVANSDGGKTKFLVILDDVWQLVDLNDIGLSPLPDQGVDFKVLLTSRDRVVCRGMGVGDDLVLNVGLLMKEEAQTLFQQSVKKIDPALQKIGDDIVSRCHGLPIAIKTMGCNLKGESDYIWKDALNRLKNHNLYTVAGAVFGTSYDNLRHKETEATFLLCGLYPEDFEIPTEELVRYGWGLKLFEDVDNIREARYRLNACIVQLMHKNLLLESDNVGCVKMHDLVRSFVVDKLKVEHASIVNHGPNPGWPEDDMHSSCKSISITCKGMFEFPSQLKFPNLTILKLMHGDDSLRFREDFYEEMEKLQVISYHHMKCPLLPSSPQQCSTNLRVLLLHGRSLAFDLSSIGNLSNLEVLSFAESDIKSLPSTIKNLKKLRVLDLTNCHGLRIDNGVLQVLIRLEELYAFSFYSYDYAIRFTGDNCNEVEERWKNLSALEFEFFEDNAQWKNLSSENLERFKISVGRSLEEDYLEGDYLIKKIHSSENTLKLEAKKGEVSGSRINELFEKTVVLCLSVEDMNDLEDVEVKHSYPPQHSSFHNIRVLVVSKCAELKYLFTLRVAKVLLNLEYLEVFDCLVMKELVHTEDKGEETITFPKLKFLELRELPELLGLCQNVNIIVLPQLEELKIAGIPNITSIYSKNKPATSSLLRAEVLITLNKLHIKNMDGLKEIWPCDFGTIDQEVKLREIEVRYCEKLVNLFPCNPMPLLHHLEELQIRNCDSIEVLFNIDLECVGEIGEEVKLRKIEVDGCKKLVNLFPCNPMPLLHHLEELQIRNCDSIEVLFNIDLECVGEIGEEVKLRKIVVDGCNKLVNLFPCNPMPLLHHLEELQIRNCDSIEVLFNIDLECVGEIGEEGSSSSLRRIEVAGSGKLREVWRIKGGEHNSGLRISGFQHVEIIKIKDCNGFRDLLAPTTTNFDFGALIDLDISFYRKEIARNNGLVESSQQQEINTNDSTSNVAFPSCVIHSFHNLCKLKLVSGQGVEVIFEIESTPRSQDNQQTILPYLEQLHIEDMESMSHVWKCKWNDFLILQKQPSESPFHNLTTIYMSKCHNIKYLFSPLMARLLSNLKEIEIERCDGIEEVVSHRDDEDEDQATFTSTSTHASTSKLFPHLASLYLYDLQNIKCIGGAKGVNNEISVGSPTTTISCLDQHELSQEDGVSWTLCQYPREIDIWNCQLLSSVIPCYAAGHMRKLEVLKIDSCDGLKEVFETQRINNNVIMLKLTNLKKLKIESCDLLEHIFTFSTLESLIQLEKLSISNCKSMKVIVKEEDDGEQRTTSSKAVVFPSLKYIKLRDLPELVGFFLGKNNEFLWPSLNDVVIKDCPQMKVFTAGGSTAPQLEYVRTRLGKHPRGHWLNSHVSVTTTTTGQHQHQESTSSSCPAATTEGINNWSFHNLIELHVVFETFAEKHIVPSNELLHLQKLEKIHLENCDKVEEVFEGTNSTTGSDESPTTVVVKLPNLIEVDLRSVYNLRYMWKSNRWTLFEFPKLTTVSIYGCHKLQHVFTSSMVGSLSQLQELSITWCNQMEEVIVNDVNTVVEEKEEQSEGKMSEIMMLPRLRSLKLDYIPCLKGFCLGKEDFSFPLLDTLTIKSCPEITTFTKGNSSTPKLKEIETGFGWFHVEEDINTFILKLYAFREH